MSICSTTIESLRAIQAAKIKTALVFVPQFDRQLRIRELSGGDQVRFSSEYRRDAPRSETHELLIRLVSRAVIDETGNRYLDSEEGREILAELPADQLTKISDEIAELSGMMPDEEGDEKKESAPTGS